MLDAESEQVAEPSRVAAGGDGFVQNPVGAQGLDTAGQCDGEEHPSDPDGFVAAGGSEVDEQVWVGRGRPSLAAVVEPVGDPSPDGLGEGDGAPVDVQVPITDVDELEVAQLVAAQSVVGNERGERGPGRLRRAERGAHGVQVHGGGRDREVAGMGETNGRVG